MIDTILIYLIIGLMVGLLVEWSREKAMQHPDFPEEFKDGWNLSHRLLTVFIWPYAMVFYLIGIFKKR